VIRSFSYIFCFFSVKINLGFWCAFSFLSPLPGVCPSVVMRLKNSSSRCDGPLRRGIVSFPQRFFPSCNEQRRRTLRGDFFLFQPPSRSSPINNHTLWLKRDIAFSDTSFDSPIRIISGRQSVLRFPFSPFSITMPREEIRTPE